jgi:hypothetical protein
LVIELDGAEPDMFGPEALRAGVEVFIIGGSPATLLFANGAMFGEGETGAVAV